MRSRVVLLAVAVLAISASMLPSVAALVDAVGTGNSRRYNHYAGPGRKLSATVYGRFVTAGKKSTARLTFTGSGPRRAQFFSGPYWVQSGPLTGRFEIFGLGSKVRTSGSCSGGWETIESANTVHPVPSELNELWTRVAVLCSNDPSQPRWRRSFEIFIYGGTPARTARLQYR